MDDQDLDIKNLEFTSEDTGSFFTKTYTEYNWKFTLDGINRTISLYHSKILGRRTIYLGKRILCRYQRYKYNFYFSFTIDIHIISITQSDDTYILKIDGIPFNKLLNEEKLSRFNIIRQIFAGKDENNKKPNIKPLMTYKGGRGNMVISNRTANSKRDINKTNIYSDYRENDIENDKNIINTSSKRTENNSFEITNSEYYYNYNNDEESSENISNKAVDGGDSHQDEEEDEEEQEEEDNKIKESNFDEIFKKGNNLDNDNNEINNEELEEENEEEDNIENEKNDNINNIKDEDDEDDSSDEEEDEKDNDNDFNNINNELMPIKSQKKEKKVIKESEKNK